MTNILLTLSLFLSFQTTFHNTDLPDVTEHSYNPTVLPDSISNTEISITSQRSTSQQQISTSTCSPQSHKAKDKDKETTKKQRKKVLPKRTITYGILSLIIVIISAIVAAIIVNFLFLRQHFNRESFEERTNTAASILRRTPLIDGHNDLPWNIRRFAHNRLEYVNFTDGLVNDPWYKSPWSHTDLPRLKRGLVGAQFW